MAKFFHKSLTIYEIRTSAIEELFSLMSTDKDGISSQEAKNRLEEYGYNEIEEKIQKPKGKRKIQPRNKQSIELTEEKCRCPKCKSTNLFSIEGGADSSLYCLDCNYAEGVGLIGE